MAKSEYVLNIGDDNVVLTRLADGKVVNAWLGSPDPAMAPEELGEALAEDPKARISVIVDTLDQSYKEEEIPRVSILDRRKVLARHINMAFPGANMRGARLVQETDKKTLLYEFAAVPLDGRIPGWVDFIQSLPHPKGGFHAIASENVDILRALAPKDSDNVVEGNHWRHLIGVNVTGGLRQIIEKNGRLSLTRLTQAPPADTPSDEFADMIVRDFKATITYIRRLGYQVGEPLDLLVLTTPENKRVLEDLDWDGARSVSVYTPYEAGLMLDLGSLGREDQAYCDVLHAAWFASKRKSVLPLTRSAALGDAYDDLRDLSYAAAPYLGGLAAAALVGWIGWTSYELFDYQGRNEQAQAELTGFLASLSAEQRALAQSPYDASKMRNVLEVADALHAGKVDTSPILNGVYQALESDAVVLDFRFLNGAYVVPPAQPSAQPNARGPAAGGKPEYSFTVRMQLASVVATAEEAVKVSRALERRLVASFGKEYTVQMTLEPVAAQASKALKGGLYDGAGGADTGRQDDPFYTAFQIAKVGQTKFGPGGANAQSARAAK
jgi:hypothetical protein